MQLRFVCGQGALPQALVEFVRRAEKEKALQLQHKDLLAIAAQQLLIGQDLYRPATAGDTIEHVAHDINLAIGHHKDHNSDSETSYRSR